MASQAEEDRLIAEAVERYKAEHATLGERERAEREHKLWDLVPARIRGQMADIGKPGAYRWLHSVLGESCGSSYDLRNRAYLLTAAGDGTPLWAEVAAWDMPLGTATALLKQARKRAGEHNLSLREAIEKELVAYQKLPAMKRADGKIVRKGNALQRVRVQSERSGARRPVARRRGQSDRTFWRDMRELIATFVAARTGQVKLDEQQREQLWQDLERDLRDVVEHWSSKINRLRQGTQQTVTRRQLAAACLCLAIDPPAWGKPMDLMAAKRRKRELSRLYHPDRRGGDESLRDRLQAVLDAYDVCEQYAQTVGKPSATAPTLRVVNGGAAAPEEAEPIEEPAANVEDE